MAKRVLRICDRCGEEITNLTDAEAEYKLPIWPTSGRNCHDLRVDLCHNCRVELKNLLRGHFMVPESQDGTVMRDAPYAEIAGLETLVEDQIKEIGELEKELERLRDVKDKLFEANFKLTAQLRTLGVEVDEEDDEDGE